MRILTIADFLYPEIKGGSSVVVHEVMRRLQRRGHEVVLLTRGSPQTPAIIDGMTVASYRPAHNEALYPLAVARCISRLRQDLALDRFDLVNLHHAYSGFGAELRRSRSSIPSVFFFHGPWEGEAIAKEGGEAGTRAPWYRLRYRVRRCVDRYIINSCDQVVGLSDFSRAEVRAIAPSADSKFARIPGGVDLQRFCPVSDRAAIRRRLGIPEKAHIVLTIRRLDKRMGLEMLLRAMRQVESVRDDVYLIIGGKGSLRATLEESIDRLGLQRTRLAGFIPETDLPSYYQAADLFVMPSTAFEGFGLVTLESLACGTPVLATPVGANAEVLAGVLDDFVLPNVSEDAVASGIIEKLPIATDDDLRQRVRRYAEGRSWDAVADEVERLFIAVVSERKEGAA